MHFSHSFHLYNWCFHKKFALIIATIEEHDRLKIKSIFNIMPDLISAYVISQYRNYLIIKNWRCKMQFHWKLIKKLINKKEIYLYLSWFIFAKYYLSNCLNPRHLRNYQCLDICDNCYFSQFGFLTLWNGGKDEKRHGKNGTLLYMHTRTHEYRACIQRRTMLVVDLQDKYYSEKLNYRYRPPPNANSCASADRPDLPIHT